MANATEVFLRSFNGYKLLHKGVSNHFFILFLYIGLCPDADIDPLYFSYGLKRTKYASRRVAPPRAGGNFCALACFARHQDTILLQPSRCLTSSAVIEYLCCREFQGMKFSSCLAAFGRL